MKVVITVTAVYNFPDNVELEDLIEGDNVIINDRKFKPYIDFEDCESESGDKSWDESDEEAMGEIYELVDDCLESEEYTIIELGGSDFDDE